MPKYCTVPGCPRWSQGKGVCRTHGETKDPPPPKTENQKRRWATSGPEPHHVAQRLKPGTLEIDDG